MAKTSEKETATEKGARLYRNLNLAAAAGELAVAAVIPVAAGVLTGLAALNAVQAGGAEWVRSSAKKNRLRKSSR